MDKYRETILKAIREYEKQFDQVEQYEITNALGELYEIIRAIMISEETTFVYDEHTMP